VIAACFCSQSDLSVDSLSRKEREEKVRETREKLEKEKEKKLQELLGVQKTGRSLNLIVNTLSSMC